MEIIYYSSQYNTSPCLESVRENKRHLLCKPSQMVLEPAIKPTLPTLAMIFCPVPNPLHIEGSNIWCNYEYKFFKKCHSKIHCSNKSSAYFTINIIITIQIIATSKKLKTNSCGDKSTLDFAKKQTNNRHCLTMMSSFIRINHGFYPFHIRTYYGFR